MKHEPIKYECPHCGKRAKGYSVTGRWLWICAPAGWLSCYGENNGTPSIAFACSQQCADAIENTTPDVDDAGDVDDDQAGDVDDEQDVQYGLDDDAGDGEAD